MPAVATPRTQMWDGGLSMKSPVQSPARDTAIRNPGAHGVGITAKLCHCRSGCREIDRVDPAIGRSATTSHGTTCDDGPYDLDRDPSQQHPGDQGTDGRQYEHRALSAVVASAVGRVSAPRCSFVSRTVPIQNIARQEPTRRTGEHARTDRAAWPEILAGRSSRFSSSKKRLRRSTRVVVAGPT